MYFSLTRNRTRKWRLGQVLLFSISTRPYTIFIGKYFYTFFSFVKRVMRTPNKLCWFQRSPVTFFTVVFWHAKQNSPSPSFFPPLLQRKLGGLERADAQRIVGKTTADCWRDNERFPKKNNSSHIFQVKINPYLHCYSKSQFSRLNWSLEGVMFIIDTAPAPIFLSVSKLSRQSIKNPSLFDTLKNIFHPQE